MAILRENRLKKLLRSKDRVLLGSALQESREGGPIHVMARSGADFVVIDMEHMPLDFAAVADLVAHAHAADITPIVRIPELDYQSVTRVLGLGCQSLYVPNLKTRAQVEKLLELARYHPLGMRGMNMYGGAAVNYCPVTDVRETQRLSNDNLVLGLIVETREAVEALEEMLVEGIDFAIVGYDDLSQSYRVPGDLSHPHIKNAISLVRSACRERGIAYAVGVSSLSQFESAVNDGARMIMYGGVLNFVRKGIVEAVETLRAIEGSRK